MFEAEITPGMAAASASMNLAAPRRGSMYEGLRETLEGGAEMLDLLRAC